ncbi:MAG: cusR [Verrucomicrobia bacterium]|nr:cusR [Verrucomicrobiota bacterium]
MKILIVEDERRIGLFVKKGLMEQSYTVTWVRTCSEARDALCESHYDTIVLDLSLPDGDGLDLLQEWRRSGFLEPVLILSARDTVEDRIKGLDRGADDYLDKPFSLGELISRVRSLIRRQATTKETVLDRGCLRMDLTGRIVTVDGVSVDLTTREFALLEVFLYNTGRVLSRSFIAEKIWGTDNEDESKLLDVYMSRLRGKIDKGGSRLLFKTIRGVGYQLL